MARGVRTVVADPGIEHRASSRLDEPHVGQPFREKEPESLGARCIAVGRNGERAARQVLGVVPAIELQFLRQNREGK